MRKSRRTADHFSRKAKREHYPARSIYKLEEIDRRVRLLRYGYKVLDLGASPGSWTLYTAKKVGPAGRVVAVDLKPLNVELPANVFELTTDVLALDPHQLRELTGCDGFDAVISDMAPNTSGHRFVDQSRSFQLFDRALEIAALVLRRGGNFAGKIFFGEEFDLARNNVRNLFASVKLIKPASVRSESYEIYIVGLDRC